MWNAWKKIVEKVADFQSNVIFSALFFLLSTPLGLIANFFKDFLQARKEPRWDNHTDFVSTLPKLKSQ